MVCDLIVDGNFMLSKLVFTLHKNNLLYGALEQSLENSLANYRKMYPFRNSYLVSDSREKSWRKQLTKKYKGKRKKDNNIDWDFVYETYQNFKDNITTAKVLEAPTLEGDDWISYLTEKANNNNRSVMIVSNDYDIKQLIRFNIDPLYINIMSNEMYNRQKVFMPKNYEIFLNSLNKLPNDDIFNLNDNAEFSKLINTFKLRHDIHEVDAVKSLIIKLISGDKSDNIKSVWVQKGKTGKERGIGEAGAKSIYEMYLEEFGDVDLEDPDLFENIADLICEKKKLSKTKIDIIVNNLNRNSKVIDLSLENIPERIVETMKNVYNDKIKV
jgi:5'-3' exonuclease